MLQRVKPSTSFTVYSSIAGMFRREYIDDETERFKLYLNESIKYKFFIKN